MANDDDDGGGFGDFTFASSQPSNQTLHSLSNGPDLSNNNNPDLDDDWGDFVNSSKPDPTSNRIEPKQSWVKPNGALPLSLFGEEEEEEQESDRSLSNFVSNSSAKSDNKGNHSGSIKPENGPELDSGLNGLDLSVNVSNSDVNDVNLSLSRSHLNVNGTNLNANGFNFYFNAANSGTGLSNFNPNGLYMNAGLWNSYMNGLNSNNAIAVNVGGNVVDVKQNGGVSSLNGLKVDLNSNTEAAASDKEENDEDHDDDGWEFKGVEAKTGCANDLSEVKIENGPNLNLNGPNLSLNVLSPDLTRLNSNFDGKRSDSNQLNADRVDVDDDFANDDGWEFMAATSDTKDAKVDSIGSGIPEQLAYKSGLGEVTNGFGNLFCAVKETSQSSSEWGFGFEFNPAFVSGDNSMPASYPASQQNSVQSGTNSWPVINGVDFKEDSWAFNDPLPETESKDKVMEDSWAFSNSLSVTESTDKEDPEVANTSPVGVEKKGALPLSIFGEEEVESDNSLLHQDVSTDKSFLNAKHDTRNKWSNISINDLISNLYSQALQNADGSHSQNPGANGLESTQTTVDSKSVGADDDFDDDSWEFKGAFSGASVDSHTTAAFDDSEQNYSAKTLLLDYTDLYSKLKSELRNVVLSHLENLKKARSDAVVFGEDAKVKALDDEIQVCQKVLQQDGMTSDEVYSESAQTRSICLSGLVEVLKGQQFQWIESDYHLSDRLLLIEKDSASAVPLLKHATSTLRILTTGSLEEQSYYVSIWYKMLSACLHELRHGALIWKQALEKNVHGQILLTPQGKQYILALGEIFRVVEVVGASAKLYKPWIFVSGNPEGIFNHVSECSTLWSSSGLKEALEGISDSTSSDYGGHQKALLESIKCIHAHDVPALYHYSFSGEEPKCRVSLLPVGAVPSLRTVVWDGEHYFLTVANLWANFVSKDPPVFPCTQGS